MFKFNLSSTKDKIRDFLFRRLQTPVHPNNDKDTHGFEGGSLKQRKKRLSQTNPGSHMFANYTKRKRRQKHARKAVAKQQREQLRAALRAPLPVR